MRPRCHKRSLRKIAGVLSFVILGASTSRGERLPIQVYTTTDGLAQSTVHRIFRDSKGFLWFGTSEGISRYDGYEFQTYHEPGRPRQRRVRELIETRDGVFWTGTDEGVCRLNPGQRRMVSGQPILQCTKPADRAAVSVQRLFEDRAGELLAGTDAGLYRVNISNTAPEFELIPLGPRTGRQPGIFAVERDPSGGVWIGATNGLYRLREGQSPWRFSREHGLPSDEVQALEYDPEGRLWAGTKEGICLIRRSPEPGRDDR